MSLRWGRRLSLCILTSLLFLLSMPMGAGASAPVSHARVQRDQVQEIEQVLGHLEGEDRTVEYLLYVVMPALGLMGILLIFRRLFQV